MSECEFFWLPDYIMYSTGKHWVYFVNKGASHDSVEASPVVGEAFVRACDYRTESRIEAS